MITKMAYHKSSLKKKLKYGCKRHTHNIVKIALKQIFINPITSLGKINSIIKKMKLIFLSCQIRKTKVINDIL